MNQTMQLMIGLLGVLAALVSFFAYRRIQESRVGQVKLWIRDYLMIRHGAVPEPLHINCSEDRLWPVLVTFEGPGRTRHHLQFQCPGSQSTLSLSSESQQCG